MLYVIPRFIIKYMNIRSANLRVDNLADHAIKSFMMLIHPPYTHVTSLVLFIFSCSSSKNSEISLSTDYVRTIFYVKTPATSARCARINNEEKEGRQEKERVWLPACPTNTWQKS